MATRGCARHTKPKRSRCENVVSAVPAMNDVVGPCQIVCLEPASQPHDTFGIAERHRASQGFDRMDRIEVSDRGFLPETAIRSRWGFGTHQIDLMTTGPKRGDQNQHRFRGARPLPVAHELKNSQSRRSWAPGGLLRSHSFAYFKNT